LLIADGFSDLKITDLDILNLQNRTLLVRLRTDEGLVG